MDRIYQSVGAVVAWCGIVAAVVFIVACVIAAVIWVVWRIAISIRSRSGLEKLRLARDLSEAEVQKAMTELLAISSDCQPCDQIVGINAMRLAKMLRENIVYRKHLADQETADEPLSGQDPGTDTEPTVDVTPLRNRSL